MHMHINKYVLNLVLCNVAKLFHHQFMICEANIGLYGQNLLLKFIHQNIALVVQFYPPEHFSVKASL